MPGDGHCLYHALGWWADKPQAQIRARIAEVQEHTWKALFPWDNGDALRTFKEETLNPHCWGGADQIAVAAALWKVRVIVRTSFGDQVYGNDANWYLQYQGEKRPTTTCGHLALRGALLRTTRARVSRHTLPRRSASLRPLRGNNQAPT